MGMDSVDTYWSDFAALDWQVELGADEAIGDAPVNRYELPQTLSKPAAAPTPPVPDVTKPEKVDAVVEAASMANAASDLEGLRAALGRFEHCAPKRGARNTVFGHGNPAARVMVIGEAPDRDADRAGRPFAGPGEVLLGRMFEAIDLRVDESQPEVSLYLAAPMPWRAPAQPQAQDVAMMKPFLERHIALANPDVLVLMGNTACQMLLSKSGVSRLRGNWVEVLGRPAMPMAHPNSLLQTPAAKREAWADLLNIKKKLDETK